MKSISLKLCVMIMAQALKFLQPNLKDSLSIQSIEAIRDLDMY